MAGRDQPQASGAAVQLAEQHGGELVVDAEVDERAELGQHHVDVVALGQVRTDGEAQRRHRRRGGQAAAGRLLGINPFDQPDVESAKIAAREMLEGTPDDSPADFTDGAVEGRALGGDWLGGASTLTDAVAALLTQVDGQRGYLAVMAYLDRIAHADLADVRSTLAHRVRRPVTFGWGPRFLHSTGQFHKGGPAEGVYLQVTAEPVQDLQVPGKDYTFGRLIAAQAAGDATVLADHGRPVLRLHLTDVPAGLTALRAALS